MPKTMKRKRGGSSLKKAKKLLTNANNTSEKRLKKRNRKSVVHKRLPQDGGGNDTNTNDPMTNDNPIGNVTAMTNDNPIHHINNNNAAINDIPFVKATFVGKFAKEMEDIIDDFNNQLKKIFPILDEDAVNKLMTFLSLFNNRFEKDVQFKEEFQKVAQGFVGTIADASSKTLTVGSTTFINILMNMVQAIPGVGAIASIAKVANNITATAEDLTSSVRKSTESIQHLLEKITNITEKMQEDIIPKV